MFTLGQHICGIAVALTRGGPRDACGVVVLWLRRRRRRLLGALRRCALRLGACRRAALSHECGIVLAFAVSLPAYALLFTALRLKLTTCLLIAVRSFIDCDGSCARRRRWRRTREKVGEADGRHEHQERELPREFRRRFFPGTFRGRGRNRGAPDGLRPVRRGLGGLSRLFAPHNKLMEAPVGQRTHPRPNIPPHPQTQPAAKLRARCKQPAGAPIIGGPSRAVMLLQPIHGEPRRIRVDTERVIGRDMPHTHDELQTGVSDKAVSRSQLHVRFTGSSLEAESIGIGRVRVKQGGQQIPLRSGECHVLLPGTELFFLAPRPIEGSDPPQHKWRAIAGWKLGLADGKEAAAQVARPQTFSTTNETTTGSRSALDAMVVHATNARQAAEELLRRSLDAGGERLNPRAATLVAALDAALAAAGTPAPQSQPPPPPAAPTAQATTDPVGAPMAPAPAARRSSLRERSSSGPVGSSPPTYASGLRPGAARVVAAAPPAWAGGRLVLVSKPSMDVHARGAEADGSSAAANNRALTLAFSLLDDAESLYRAALPGLSVDVRPHGAGRVVDYVHDTIVHGNGCITALLVPGGGGAYDVGEQPPLGALTVRLHAAESPTGGASRTVGAAGGDGAVGAAGGDGAVGAVSDGDGYIEVLTCAVRRHAQRSGVGSLLVRWMLSLAARTRNLRCLLVAASGEAIPFWQRLGFGDVPNDVPQKWVSGLHAQFEHSTVLHLAAPNGEGTDASLHAAEARLQESGTSAKRQRRTV